MTDASGRLPGEELVNQGLADLAKNQKTDCAWLVLIASPRLVRLGISVPIPDWPRPYEHQLYDLLEQRLGDDTHSHYNSLLRRMASYAQALEREQTQTSHRDR